MVSDEYNDSSGAPFPLSIYPSWLNDSMDYLFNNLPIELSNNSNKYKLNGIEFEHTKLINTNIDINYINGYIPTDIDKKLIDIQNKYLEKLEKINSSDKYNESKKEQHRKELLTKTNKLKNNINKIIKSYKFQLSFTKEQQQILNNWFKHCDDLYNMCVLFFNELSTEFEYSLDYKKEKIDMFKIAYGNEPKPVPYDILTDIVREYCSNIKSNFTKLREGLIDKFELKPKINTKYKSILIPKKSITKNGIFTNFVGQIIDFDKKININNIGGDCRLIYDSILNKYYLSIPQYTEKHIIKNKNPIVSLDPGEKNFMTYYSMNETGNIGKDIRIPILKIRSKISRYQRILKKNKNKKGKRIKNKKGLKKKIQKKYNKTKNIVKELHNQTALYLCKNYERILIPKFETQNMVSNRDLRNKAVKEAINKIKNNNELSNIEKKKELRKYTKKCRLSRNVKYVLNQLSHYTFRQHLLNKSLDYGCSVKVITEEYTSQCCGKCMKLSKSYNIREKNCIHCNYKIDRDVNGSRNILIKNYNDVIEYGSNAVVTTSPN
jgi:IS605 OrfB family transposase